MSPGRQGGSTPRGHAASLRAICAPVDWESQAGPGSAAASTTQRTREPGKRSAGLERRTLPPLLGDSPPVGPGRAPGASAEQGRDLLASPLPPNPDLSAAGQMFSNSSRSGVKCPVSGHNGPPARAGPDPFAGQSARKGLCTVIPAAFSAAPLQRSARHNGPGAARGSEARAGRRGPPLSRFLLQSLKQLGAESIEILAGPLPGQRPLKGRARAAHPGRPDAGTGPGTARPGPAWLCQRRGLPCPECAPPPPPACRELKGGRAVPRFSTLRGASPRGSAAARRGREKEGEGPRGRRTGEGAGRRAAGPVPGPGRRPPGPLSGRLCGLPQGGRTGPGRSAGRVQESGFSPRREPQVEHRAGLQPAGAWLGAFAGTLRLARGSHLGAAPRSALIYRPEAV